MVNLSNTQVNNVPTDLFTQGQMAVERIKTAQECVSSTRCVDYDVAFGILGIEKGTQEEVGDEASIPL